MSLRVGKVASPDPETTVCEVSVGDGSAIIVYAVNVVDGPPRVRVEVVPLKGAKR